MQKKIPHGFTLIEVLIVVAIISLLAAIAYPSYRNFVSKGQRAEGRAALADLLQQQERYMTQRNCYLGFTTAANSAATPSAPSPSTACGGITAATVPFKSFVGDSFARATYLLSADLCPDGAGGTLSIADCVRVVATPIPAGSDPEAGALRVTSTGAKDCTGTNSTVCWK